MSEYLKTLPVGYISEQGQRYSNEDTELDSEFSIEDTYFRILGVFDGHGGSAVSNLLADNLVQYLRETIKHPDKLHDDILEACEKLNLMILDDSSADYAGSCAIFCLLRYNFSNGTFSLITANTGDSRAILSTKNGPIQLNREHKPYDPHEKEYIESHGGEVIGIRLNGSLAVSRAFGDKDLVPVGLRSTPEIVEFDLLPENNFLVIACDGLWDVMSNEDVFSLVKYQLSKNVDVNEIAKILVTEALNNGSMDNISVIIADLHSLVKH